MSLTRFFLCPSTHKRWCGRATSGEKTYYYHYKIELLYNSETWKEKQWNAGVKAKFWKPVSYNPTLSTWIYDTVGPDQIYHYSVVRKQGNTVTQLSSDYTYLGRICELEAQYKDKEDTITFLYEKINTPVNLDLSGYAVKSVIEGGAASANYIDYFRYPLTEIADYITR